MFLQKYIYLKIQWITQNQSFFFVVRKISTSLAWLVKIEHLTFLFLNDQPRAHVGHHFNLINMINQLLVKLGQLRLADFARHFRQILNANIATFGLFFFRIKLPF